MQICLRMYDLLLPLGIKGLRQSDILSVSFNSKQKLSEERLNSQKLIWFYLLEKFFYLQSVYPVW